MEVSHLHTIFQFLIFLKLNISSFFILFLDKIKDVPCENSSQCPRSTCFPHGSPKCVSEKCKCDYGIN
uniref:Nodule-specific cysteine-rich peptide L19 n=1 Tax=Lens culinaris TaxID=3864 RepID=A0A7T8DV89_LENCU|nr:nodule-specific cysteine-rich peptide L19 [Lens culinaris]